MAKKQSATNRRITDAYNKVASGAVIDIMDITRIWDAAEAAVKSGADDAGVETAITGVLATIRKH